MKMNKTDKNSRYAAAVVSQEITPQMQKMLGEES
jgi:hypothetical protein